MSKEIKGCPNAFVATVECAGETWVRGKLNARGRALKNGTKLHTAEQLSTLQANLEQVEKDKAELVSLISHIDTICNRLFQNPRIEIKEAIAKKEIINKLAAWMTERGISTGHGDTIDGLLYEFDSHDKEVRAKALEDAEKERDK